ncbi:hypothetical protein HYS48_01315 [Candidatus Woesearchaeota archaeon]|nr:hypothetical protein [Candidatus Woesearchaeota archaeon]
MVSVSVAIERIQQPEPEEPLYLRIRRIATVLTREQSLDEKARFLTTRARMKEFHYVPEKQDAVERRYFSGKEDGLILYAIVTWEDLTLVFRKELGLSIPRSDFSIDHVLRMDRPFYDWKNENLEELWRYLDKGKKYPVPIQREDQFENYIVDGDRFAREQAVSMVWHGWTGKDREEIPLILGIFDRIPEGSFAALGIDRLMGIQHY